MAAIVGDSKVIYRSKLKEFIRFFLKENEIISIINHKMDFKLKQLAL